MTYNNIVRQPSIFLVMKVFFASAGGIFYMGRKKRDLCATILVKLVEKEIKFMEKQKKKISLWNIIVRFFKIVLVICAILMAYLFIFSSSPAYVGYCVEGNITVKVNGENVIPDNIVCYLAGSDREYQKTKIKYYDEHLFIKAKASKYGNYFFEFDVDTEDGSKTLVFAVFKTHAGGPTEKFNYDLELNKEEGEWVAYVSLGDTYVKEERILLSDDPDAFIETGP